MQPAVSLVGTLPWYTWIAVALLVLFVIGALWSFLKFVVGMCVVAFSASWWGLCMVIARLTRLPLMSAGTACWARTHDLTLAGVWNDSGLALGTWKNGRTIREPRGAHVLVCAPPRSGKSWGIVMPNLREYRGSCIITDLRGELHSHTAETRATFGSVLKFDPGSADSCSLNLLDSVPWHLPSRYAFCDRIAHHILAPTGNAIGDEFRSNAIPLLRAILVDRASVNDASFPAIVDWMLAVDSTMNEKLETLLAHPDPYVQRGARRTMDMSPKLRAGAWNAILEPLALFEDPEVRAHTTTSDCRLDDLLFGVTPLTIYVTTSFDEIARMGRFFGLLIEIVVGIVSAPHPPARHPLLLCLDEMANLHKLPELERAVSYLQGSGAQLLAIFQNINQVIELYGPTSPLLNSISSHVFYCPVPTDLTTASLVSRTLGQATVQVVSTSQTAAGESVSIAERGRPLLTTDEVTRLPKSDALIFLQEQPPIYAAKLGQPAASIVQRVSLTLVRHPDVSVAALVVSLFAYCLWPLAQLNQDWHAALPTRQTVSEAAITLGIRPPASSGAGLPTPDVTTVKAQTWQLMLRSPGKLGQSHVMAESLYESEADCLQAMQAQYEPQLQRYEQQGATVERQPTRFRWQYTPRGADKAKVYEAWCSQQ